jgi:hypothetical protein
MIWIIGEKKQNIQDIEEKGNFCYKYKRRHAKTCNEKNAEGGTMKIWTYFPKMAAVLVLCTGIWAVPAIAFGHCDTLDGPVIMTATAALEKGDVTPVLKWVKKENEGEIRELFRTTVVVRGKGPEAKELADRYFFETLVRIHRAGEGAPYTGLKPAGSIEPSVAAADKALESGSADDLVKLVTDAAAQGIRERFARTLETKKHADHTVEAGRAFVAAYVDFTHYVERLHMDAVAGSGHIHEQAPSGGPHKH